jgi:predicted metalloprotease
MEPQISASNVSQASAEQRQEWFVTGYENGSADACDTFEAEI